MALYLSSGYVNIKYVLGYNCPFTFLLGGRGTGKTFGALEYAIDSGRKIMFMRRTRTQIELITRPELDPFNPVCEYKGIGHKLEPVAKDVNSIILVKEEQETPLGLCAALSTFSNLRGFDASWINLLLMDELIPEPQERPIKNEGSAFLNCYETINRNRELQGRPALQALCMTNSNSINSPLLIELDLVRVIEKMRRKGQREYVNKDRGIAIFDLKDSPISAAKNETALYKATRGTKFAAMAIGNEFSYSDMSDCRSQPLNGLRLLWRYANIYCYQAQGYLYISEHGAGTAPAEYEDTEIDTARFVREHRKLYQQIIKRKIRYENYMCKKRLTELFI